MMMARKPNYAFERKERDRLKAEKKAKRAAAKRDAREQKSGADDLSDSSDAEHPNPISTTSE
jgi:hypothetical protein